MELYEVVKITNNSIIAKNVPNGIISVITATMDRQIAEQMLEIYRQNADENESYQIRTLRKLEAQPFDYGSVSYERCLSCNSYDRCKDFVINHPNAMMRCMNFDELKKYVKSL